MNILRSTPGGKFPVTSNSLELLELEDHRTIAQKLGVGVTTTDKALTLRKVLAELGMYSYDSKRVYDFMAKKGRQESTQSSTYHLWWYPVRKFDAKAVSECYGLFNRSSSYGELRNFWNFDNKRDAWVEHSVYQKPIPLPVLMTMDSLVEKLGPENLVFLVGDLSAPQPKDPDPFLSVTSPSFDCQFVIERWNEPSFRG